MKIFDTETFLLKSKEMLMANLSAEIDIINNEKNDFNLDYINDSAWYFQNLNDEIFSYPVFIVWGVLKMPETVETNGGVRIRKENVFFEVVLSDNGDSMSENDFFKLLRYTRALETAVQNNFYNVMSGIKVSVSGLSPTSFELGGSVFRSAGISIEAVIAN